MDTTSQTEAFLIALAARFPAWVVAALAVAAALSFAARHRQQFLRGRIREYPAASLAVAAAWATAALFYAFLGWGTADLDALRAVSRVVWSLLALTCVAFNGGAAADALREMVWLRMPVGVRVTWRRSRTAARRAWRVLARKVKGSQ